MIEFGVYEKRLKKNGVRIISITQVTPDDATGEMARRFMSMFDEYQSKENSKHTSRAMCENARQGYYNGSSAPYGYRAQQSDVMGTRGRKKKKLVIDEMEAGIVREIYRLYLHGRDGQTMGLKEIVKYLTESGQRMRGNPWRKQKVHNILSSRAYLGEHMFYVKNSKTGQVRPPTEWIPVLSDPIIDAETFEKVRILRERRSPLKTPPRAVSSPTLLAGIVRCECGSAMTLATGKSGNYRYYKCTSRVSKSQVCRSKNLPVDKFDTLILDALAQRIFTPERLQTLMAELRKRVRDSKDSEQSKVNDLNRQVKATEERLGRLYEAVETGVLPLDEMLQKRAEQLRTGRDALLVELANVRKAVGLPAERILPSTIEAFSKGIRRKFQSDKSFAKRYLQLLVDEIVVTDTVITIRGSHATLAAAISAYREKAGTDVVPSFVSDWRARRDSNPRPAA